MIAQKKGVGRDAHVSSMSTPLLHTHHDGLVRHSFRATQHLIDLPLLRRLSWIWVWACLSCIRFVHNSIKSICIFYVHECRWGISILDVWCKPRADPVAVCRCPGRVIVVGAGLAGLVAAQSLRRAECLPAKSESECFKQKGFGCFGHLKSCVFRVSLRFRDQLFPKPQVMCWC